MMLMLMMMLVVVSSRTEFMTANTVGMSHSLLVVVFIAFSLSLRAAHIDMCWRCYISDHTIYGRDVCVRVCVRLCLLKL